MSHSTGFRDRTDVFCTGIHVRFRISAQQPLFVSRAVLPRRLIYRTAVVGNLRWTVQTYCLRGRITTGPRQNESCPFPRTALNTNPAAVFPNNFSTDGKADSSAAFALGRFKQIKDRRTMILRNAWTIVGDCDQHDVVCRDVLY